MIVSRVNLTMKINTFFYSIKQGLKNIFRNKMFSLASIATMAACIFMFGLFYIIISNDFNSIMLFLNLYCLHCCPLSVYILSVYISVSSNFDICFFSKLARTCSNLSISREERVWRRDLPVTTRLQTVRTIRFTWMMCQCRIRLLPICSPLMECVM